MTLRLEWVDELDAVREDWAPLARRSGNVFATFEFAAIWWSHFGPPRATPRVAVARDEHGAVVAIVPLYLWRARPLRIVRLLGHGPGDELGPVVAETDVRRPAPALRLALDELPGGWSVFLGEQLRGDRGYAGALPGRVLSRDGSPVLRFADRGWDDFLAARSRNLREQATRRERKLFREHDCRYRTIARPGELADALDVVLELHRSRWSRSDFAAAERFHREWAACALERGWLRLWILDVDGEARAAWLGFRFAGAESYYQAGRDPAWDGASVGFVLLVHTIREALGDGMREYRFLRGGESYKHRFADYDGGLETIGAGRSLTGRAAIALAPAARLVRRGLTRGTSARDAAE